MLNPTGKCMCGCGGDAPIAQTTNKRRGYVKGEPTKYIRGHSSYKYERTWDHSQPLPLCACGCGGQVTLSKLTDPKRGTIAGEPNKFLHGHHPKPEPTWGVEDHGYETPCWIWRGHIDNRGYGRLNVSGYRGMLAHRWMYQSRVRELTSKESLHHLCSVKACINPDHLEVMSRSAHMTLHRSKVTPDQVRLIEESILSQRRLAEAFGISQGLVWRIKHGQHRFSESPPPTSS